jgi:hypothetical protein
MKLWTWREENLPSVWHAVRTAVAATLSVLVARMVILPEAYWAVIATLVVMQSPLSSIVALAIQRIVASALGASARGNRIRLLRRKSRRVRTHNLPPRTHIYCVSVGKGRVQLRRHDACDHRAYPAAGGTMDRRSAF